MIPVIYFPGLTNTSAVSIAKDHLCDDMNDFWNTFYGANENLCSKYN